MAIVINLYLVPRYDLERVGLWCPKCLRPSGFELPHDRIMDSGVTPSVVTLRKCADCNTLLDASG